MLKTLYISSQEVPDSRWMVSNKTGTGIMLSLTTFNSGFKKCKTLVCAPPEQWTMP